MHIVLMIEHLIQISILHIAQATAKQLQLKDLHKVGLLDTKYTVRETFYREHIEAAGIEVILPSEKDIEIINRIIFVELCLGNITNFSRQVYLNIMDKMKEDGAQAVIM